MLFVNKFLGIDDTFMNHDAEIAGLMLWGHLGLTLIALGAALFGIYIAIMSSYVNASFSLDSIVASSDSAYLNQIRMLGSVSNSNSALVNSLFNNSTADLSNLLNATNQSENQISKEENNLNLYPYFYSLITVLGGIIFACSELKLRKLESSP